MQPKTYIHSGLGRWLQVAFSPPAPSWRAEGAGAARICASEALKAGDLGLLTGAQASRAALAGAAAAEPPDAQGVTFRLTHAAAMLATSRLHLQGLCALQRITDGAGAEGRRVCKGRGL